MTWPIQEILAIHDSHSFAPSQVDILGDGFLLKNNPIYRNVKGFAHSIGCDFVEAWPQYLLLPFHELNHIITSKRIPYVAHGRMLREIETQRPGIFNTETLRMPESYHLHEAAHVIAEHFFKDKPLIAAQEKIVKFLLSESFANTVDALACVPAVDEVHRFFLMHNCYMHPQKKNMVLMSRLTMNLGFECTFMLVLFAYLHANFLGESFSRELIEELVSRYAPKVILTPKLLKDCLALSGMSEQLDPRFRVQTTEIFLRLEGFSGDFFELLNFPFMPVVRANESFRSVTESMAAILQK